MSNHLLNPTLAVTVLMNLKSQCISTRISVLQIDICTVATLIYNILYCVGDSIAERNNFAQNVITEIMAVGSQYSIKITEYRLRKISTDPLFITTRRQIQLPPRLYRRVVVATLGVDSHPGGGKGPAAGAFVNTKRKSSERTLAVVTQLTDLADFLHSLITRLSLQDLLPERKLDAGLRFGHGGKGGLFLGVILHIKILGDGDSREDAEDDQHGYDFDQGKTQTVRRRLQRFPGMAVG